jgi:hypothetical protein
MYEDVTDKAVDEETISSKAKSKPPIREDLKASYLLRMVAAENDVMGEIPKN